MWAAQLLKGPSFVGDMPSNLQAAMCLASACTCKPAWLLVGLIYCSLNVADFWPAFICLWTGSVRMQKEISELHAIANLAFWIKLLGLSGSSSPLGAGAPHFAPAWCQTCSCKQLKRGCLDLLVSEGADSRFCSLGSQHL